MMSCVVLKCNSHSSRRETSNDIITFHRFPKDEVVKNKWIKLISRSNWRPKTHSHICSKHFTADSFPPNENFKYRRLYESAIPTLNIYNRKTIDEIEIKDEPSDYSVLHFQTPQLDLEDPLKNLSPENMSPNHFEMKDDEISILHRRIKDLKTELADHKKLIGVLTNKLERSMMINKQRSRKINTLTKRNTRICAKNIKLFNVLLEKEKH